MPLIKVNPTSWVNPDHIVRVYNSLADGKYVVITTDGERLVTDLTPDNLNAMEERVYSPPFATMEPESMVGTAVEAMKLGKMTFLAGSTYDFSEYMDRTLFNELVADGKIKKEKP